MKYHIMLATPLVLSIASCVYVVKDNHFYFKPVPEVHAGVMSCAPIELPAFKPFPEKPVLTKAQAADREVSDTILVNKIKELGEYAIELRRQIQDAREAQLKTCRTH